MVRRRLVGYIRVERRRDRRRPIALAARIGDQAVTIIDISLGGMGVAAVTVRSGELRTYHIGHQHRVVLEVPSYGLLELLAEVARVDAARQFLGLRFRGLDPVSYRVIERLAIGRPVLPAR
mgnify:CR=1 FL=1